MNKIIRALDIPPVWLVAFMALVAVQTQLWQPVDLDAWPHSWPGAILIIGGIALTAWSAVQFRQQKTSIVPRNVPAAFIAAGPYKFSRNPIYLADALILLGFALLMSSGVGVLTVPIFMAMLYYRFIKGEEAGLKAAFPEETAAFFKTTRRWL